jgi:hypothetical protein
MDEITFSILDLLYEDYYNPWELEVQIAARSVLIPALEDLINKDLIGWYYRDRDIGADETLPWSRLTMPTPILSDDSTWQGTPPEEPQALLGLTPAGDAAIREEYAARKQRG